MAQGQLGLYGQCPAEIRQAALRVKARVYDWAVGNRTRSISADDLGSEEERAAGGPGPGAVDPGERGVLTDRTTADCGRV